ncbi:MAG: hypothetical protein QOF35_1343 [Actinomycetota bacterium]|nr:hypothetical protein [Actinomycetota bacterium]
MIDVTAARNSGLPVLLAMLTLVTGCSGGAVPVHPSPTRPSRTAPVKRPVIASASPTNGLDVAAENAKPGSRDWRIKRLGSRGAIEGFATRTDLLPGQPLHLAVSTAAPRYRVRAFRAGWYGGAAMRQVFVSADLPGRLQRAPKLISPTDTVSTGWRPTATIQTTGWPPGAYLLRLDASTGGQRFVPVTIRSEHAKGALLLLNAVTTWQAYNAWGGYSLYHGPGGESDFTHRSRVVSFDRPYGNDGQGDFIGNELPAISLAEKLNLPLAYATDVDLHGDAHLLDGARGLISLGHDEYWSTAMRHSATVARDQGVNIAFLGANAVFRHIRLADGPLSDGADRAYRMEVNYKRPTGDPANGKNNPEVTVDWREPPVSKPESSLTGTLYECNPVRADLVVTDPSSWLWRGVASAGTHVPGMVGSEYDRVNPGAPTPGGIEVLTHSPVRCRGIRSYSDSAYYVVPSGAGVFDAGTSAWVAALDPTCTRCITTRRGTAQITAVTTRLLHAMAAGPMALSHPAAGNLAHLHEYSGDPIAARVNAR